MAVHNKKDILMLHYGDLPDEEIPCQQYYYYGSLLCEPKEWKPDQVIVNDPADFCRSRGLVTHTHMHMYVPGLARSKKGGI